MSLFQYYGYIRFLTDFSTLQAHSSQRGKFLYNKITSQRVCKYIVQFKEYNRIISWLALILIQVINIAPEAG